MDAADLYLRLSLDFEGATSIDRQEADCRRWCAENGLRVRRVHVDRGVSGFATTARRDGFDAAVAAVAAGEVPVLVVWKLDRLSRRGVGQIGQVLDQFEQAGARLVSVQDRLDTAQPQARMIIALLSEFARAESESMGVRIRSAKSAQRARGVWLSGKPPFGYQIGPDKRLQQVEPAASAMREVFQMIAAGHTLTQACAMLNARGLRNAHGGLWRTGALSGAISTCAYAGLTPQRHVTADGRHAAGRAAVYRDRDTGREVSCLSRGAKPIVTRELQLAAFAVLESRLTRFGTHPHPGRPSHALLTRGRGRCASCDQALVTFGNSYRCRRVDTAGAPACGSPVSVTIKAVDTLACSSWLQLITTDTSHTVELRRQVALLWNPTPARASTSARTQAALVDARLRLADADTAHYVRGDLDAVRHARVARTLTRAIVTLEQALTQDVAVVDTSILDDPHQVAQRWDQSSIDGRRRLLRLAYARVTVVKARTRGGVFDPARVTYHRHPQPSA